MSEYIPTLATQFEVLLDQLDTMDLAELTKFDIKLLRLLSLQSRDALNVAREELNAVESQFTQQVAQNLDDLFSCVYENPSEHTEELEQPLEQQELPEWVQLSVIPPELSPQELLNFRIKEVQINEMDNVTELKTVALQLLEYVKMATKQDKLYRQMLADLMFPEIAALRGKT